MWRWRTTYISPPYCACLLRQLDPTAANSDADILADSRADTSSVVLSIASAYTDIRYPGPFLSGPSTGHHLVAADTTRSTNRGPSDNGSSITSTDFTQAARSAFMAGSLCVLG